MGNGKTKIKLVTLGHIPFALDTKNIKDFSSEIFEINPNIEHFDNVEQSANGTDWAYTDGQLAAAVPPSFSEDILIVLVSLPLERNYYFRPLHQNTFVLSFHEIAILLQWFNIPLENLVYRVLYATSLCHQASKQTGVSMSDIIEALVHDETKGCLFDMAGRQKYEVIHSTVKPTLCIKCSSTLGNRKVSESTLKIVREELPRIRKDVFYSLQDWIKKHPIRSLAISSASIIFLGVISSAITPFILDFLVWVKGGVVWAWNALSIN